MQYRAEQVHKYFSDFRHFSNSNHNPSNPRFTHWIHPIPLNLYPSSPEHNNPSSLDQTELQVLQQTNPKWVLFKTIRTTSKSVTANPCFQQTKEL